MSKPIATINLVVYNGEKYIRYCLDSVLAQSYPHELIEINILDNASTDFTKDIIESVIENLKLKIENCMFEKSNVNLGMWPGQEELLKHSHGQYVLALSVDVILDPDFIKNAVETMERDQQIGALQAKVYKYDIGKLQTTQLRQGFVGQASYKLQADIIDTLGFQIFRSRRIINIGHGEQDHGQYNDEREIFAVEGAVPVFRRQALEDCRLKSQDNKIVDPDYFWYGDDLDLTWRMRLFGWKQVYNPRIIAYHDRKTTKTLAGNWKEFIKIRKTIPVFKRRLDWRNTTLTIIKNDFASDLLSDSYYILWRQLRLWFYFLLFEPAMFIEILKVAKILPKMLKRRGEIMKKARLSAEKIHYWFN